MTPLPCPKCGYDCRDLLDRGRQIAKRRAERTGRVRPIRLTWLHCPACRKKWDFSPGISLDGVGPERLVPVGSEK